MSDFWIVIPITAFVVVDTYLVWKDAKEFEKYAKKVLKNEK